ncbi:acyltransferase [Endozoicomonas sp. 4G]|uniref:acyltransferase family protein n=1 Tax=Endozoicomonas sp. 4G TaxID=2872754 RepID=UPI0020786281|nr:acyltransferase [Endozoicomonas sp. 4G]
MNTRVSLYLDLLRFLAAFIVMISHVAMERITGGSWQWIRDLRIGSDTVIVFFVLSGYVIAYVADIKREDRKNYLINRFSRLYSVVIPALLLTMFVDWLGIMMAQDFYETFWYSKFHDLARFFASFFYVNQIWTINIRPFSNGPFWSLSYEFWYYMMFFTVFYFTGYKRIILTALVLAIMGLKLWLLAPVWWMGVWTYRKSKTIEHSSGTGWLLFLSPIVIYGLIKYLGISDVLLDWTNNTLGSSTVFRWLRYSDEFIISYVYMILISMHFLGLVTVAKNNLAWLERWQKPIRFWAGLTFSLYLFHYPLMNFFAAVFPGDIHSGWRHLSIIAGIMIITVIVGTATERHKYKVRDLFRRLWDSFSSKKANIQIT